MAYSLFIREVQNHSRERLRPVKTRLTPYRSLDPLHIRMLVYRSQRFTILFTVLRVSTEAQRTTWRVAVYEKNIVCAVLKISLDHVRDALLRADMVGNAPLVCW